MQNHGTFSRAFPSKDKRQQSALEQRNCTLLHLRIQERADGDDSFPAADSYLSLFLTFFWPVWFDPAESVPSLSGQEVYPRG